MSACRRGPCRTGVVLGRDREEPRLLAMGCRRWGADRAALVFICSIFLYISHFVSALQFWLLYMVLCFLNISHFVRTCCITDTTRVWGRSLACPVGVRVINRMCCRNHVYCRYFTHGAPQALCACVGIGGDSCWVLLGGRGARGPNGRPRCWCERALRGSIGF